MTFTEFNQSLTHLNPPANLSVYLQAMWFDAKDNWQQAHELIQDLNDTIAAHIHAYLHRKEGDAWNADYWYNRAGRNRPATLLEEEWENITRSLLNQ